METVIIKVIQLDGSGRTREASMSIDSDALDQSVIPAGEILSRELMELRTKLNSKKTTE